MNQEFKFCKYNSYYLIKFIHFFSIFFSKKLINNNKCYQAIKQLEIFDKILKKNIEK